jgi:putative tryptophan/tyrosine transport system substrate-binding protein
VDRREFIRGAALGLLIAPLAAGAQDGTKLPRIGVLFIGPRDEALASYITAHEEGLTELGWTRNRNLIIEERFSGTADRLPAAVAELLHLNVRAIVTGPSPFIDVARRATTTIPIVMVYATDPVGRGYIASLARPGGNITGLAFDPTPDIAGKWVELLSELRPRRQRIAVIVDPEYRHDLPYREAAQIAAKNRSVTVQYVEVHWEKHALGVARDLPQAFDTITSQRADAIIVFLSPFLWGLQPQISDLALRNGLPTLSPYREGPRAGGLMSYGPNLRESWRRAATYVDKILKGAKPADLPVEQPTKFELIINLKTAKALGLTISPSLLLRADQVIE